LGSLADKTHGSKRLVTYDFVNLDMLSPVVVFVYKRLGHTKKTLESLARNELASSTDLIIFSDGPKSVVDQEEVVSVRKYLKNISGFKSVSIFERSTNYGLSKSILEGVTQTVNQFGNVIVLEDDLVTSTHFLRYMNEALKKYEYEEKVISVHGYIYPVQTTLPETFFLIGADCWGWGTWKRGWDCLIRDGLALKTQIENGNRLDRFDFYNSYPYMRMLDEQIRGKNNSWAILWYASAFVQDKLTLYPGTSLVQNIGNDNSGTHGSATNAYDVSVTSYPIDLSYSPPLEDDIVVVNLISQYFRKNHSLKNWILYILKRILIKIRK
jgi:hypothetical protein